MPSWDTQCEGCGKVDFKVCNRGQRDEPTPCEDCGKPTHYIISKQSLGSIYLEDTKMWEDADNPGSLTKLRRKRHRQNGNMSMVGRIRPEDLHIDNIRKAIDQGKVSKD